MWYYPLLEKEGLPDWMIRLGLKQVIARRLRGLNQRHSDPRQSGLEDLIHRMDKSEISPFPGISERTSQELPAEFYQLCLGKHMKYSCALWEGGSGGLDEAELAMLELTCNRADLRMGQHVLELGCGWGSLSLYLAEKYPQSHFTAVSHSPIQNHWIECQAKQRGLANLVVLTKDMNDFNPEGSYDRIITVEMLEHLRNFRRLLEKVRDWLSPGGKLFIHIFTHKKFGYLIEDLEKDSWLGRYFYTGGIMPSDDLLLKVSGKLRLQDHWHINGQHYARTATAWLGRMDLNRRTILEILQQQYGPEESVAWLCRWRIFFMACAILWNYDHGDQWMVSHYLFQK
jgi:cyclopropane-fatty-acyl-phospholipid synthase